MSRIASLSAVMFVTYTLLPQVGFSKEAPAYIKEYAKASQLQRPQAIADAERNIAAIRDSVQRSVQLGQPKRDAMKSGQAAINDAKLRMAKLTDPKEPFYASVTPQSLKVGSIGRLNWIDAGVFQIIDKENMLVELSWQVQVTKYMNSARAATEDNVYDGSERRTSIVWVRGIDTSDLTTGKGLAFQGVAPQGVFAVREARTYETYSGSKTVPVLEEVDIAPWSHLFTMTGELRTWRDKSGKHSTEAALSDYKSGFVHLEQADRKPLKLKLSELSEDDQSYVREQMQIRRKVLSAGRSR